MAGDGPSRAGQVRQRGRELGAELNQAVPSSKLPPIINKPTYSTPMKNLRAAHYITSELDGLQGEDLGKSKPGSRNSWTLPIYSSRRWSRAER
jgi:hypothetical protein